MKHEHRMPDEAFLVWLILQSERAREILGEHLDAATAESMIMELRKLKTPSKLEDDLEVPAEQVFQNLAQKVEADFSKPLPEFGKDHLDKLLHGRGQQHLAARLGFRSDVNILEEIFDSSRLADDLGAVDAAEADKAWPDCEKLLLGVMKNALRLEGMLGSARWGSLLEKRGWLREAGRDALLEAADQNEWAKQRPSEILAAILDDTRAERNGGHPGHGNFRFDSLAVQYLRHCLEATALELNVDAKNAAKEATQSLPDCHPLLELVARIDFQRGAIASALRAAMPGQGNSTLEELILESGGEVEISTSALEPAEGIPFDFKAVISNPVRTEEKAPGFLARLFKKRSLSQPDSSLAVAIGVFCHPKSPKSEPFKVLDCPGVSYAFAEQIKSAIAGIEKKNLDPDAAGFGEKLLGTAVPSLRSKADPVANALYGLVHEMAVCIAITGVGFPEVSESPWAEDLRALGKLPAYHVPQAQGGDLDFPKDVDAIALEITSGLLQRNRVVEIFEADQPAKATA